LNAPNATRAGVVLGSHGRHPPRPRFGRNRCARHAAALKAAKPLPSSTHAESIPTTPPLVAFSRPAVAGSPHHFLEAARTVTSYKSS
jgi:hypothetical protein